MYRKRSTFIKGVMMAFVLIVAALQFVGYLKVAERNSYDVVLGLNNIEKADMGADASVGEVVQYN